MTTNILTYHRYFVNALITDDTATTEVVLFDEAMTALLNISCTHLVMSNSYVDEKKLPPEIVNIIGLQRVFHLTIRKEKSIVVNDVSAHTPTDDTATADEPNETANIPPSTPDPKTTEAKRIQHSTPGIISQPPYPTYILTAPN